jgi:hypothetical protein
LRLLRFKSQSEHPSTEGVKRFTVSPMDRYDLPGNGDVPLVKHRHREGDAPKTRSLAVQSG